MLAKADKMVAEQEVVVGDCLEVLRQLDDCSVDAVVTDPPYGMSQDPDIAEVMRHWLAGDKYEHGSSGFMGKTWDSFVPGPEYWRECYRVLKPGGHLLAFSSTRTDDLLSIAIRFAGFERRDKIRLEGEGALGWLYGCLTEDAEVLTAEGWRRGIEVQVGDRIAAWDSVTGAVMLQSVEQTTVAPWRGDLVRFVNDDTDQLLTPNHRVYHLPQQREMKAGVRRSWYGAAYEVAEAGDIERWSPIKLPVAGLHEGPGIGGEDYAALLGWVWTEGGFDKVPSTGVRIYQSPSANPERVEEIDALTGRIVPSRKCYSRDRIYRYKGPYTEVSWFFTGEMARRVRADLPGKHPSWDLLWRMTLAEKQAFWDAAMKRDGSGYNFFQKDFRDLEWAQALLSTMGMRGKIAMRKPPRDGGSISVTARATTELQARHLKDAKVLYEGTVWCVKVASGAFVARRKGKVFITGNSGFPKSLDVSKAIDNAAGVKREVLGVSDNWCESKRDREQFGSMEVRGDNAGLVTAPATVDAKRWQGWGTALKPAWEPILVFRRPLAGTVAASVLEYGTGAINIDACRISTGDKVENHARSADAAVSKGIYGNSSEQETHQTSGQTLGRWPANIVISHFDECEYVGEKSVRANGHFPVARPGGSQVSGPSGHVGQDDLDERHMDGETVKVWRCAPGCPVAEMDAQSGAVGAAAAAQGPTRDGASGSIARGVYNGTGGDEAPFYADKGGASRFFYVAKAARSEREAGCEHLLPRSGAEAVEREEGTAGLNNPRAGAGRTASKVRNYHPTVKPIALMRWLIRLVTPPGGIVLDPFCGSGTTLCAAALEGVNALGVEMEPNYAKIAEARVAYWRRVADAGLDEKTYKKLNALDSSRPAVVGSST